LQLMAGTGAMLIVWLVAIPVSRVLNEPDVARYLCLLALDIPLFSLVQAHRHILTGIGAFGHCAAITAGRSVARLVLIVLLVEVGLSIDGAILGTIGASAVEFIIARRAVQPALFRRVSVAEWPLWDYAFPLFFSAVSMNSFVRLDLLAVKALGGTAVQAGLYGAAQNLALLPGLVGTALLPFLLSTLSRVLSAGNAPLGRELGRNAMRVALYLLPVAAVAAGASEEIVVFFFGESFNLSAPILAILITGSVALLVMTVAITILIAIGNPRVTLVLTAPLVPLAILGHLIAIPRWGSSGAATVTTLLGTAGAVAAVWTVYRHWDLAPPAGTLWRSLVIAVLIFGFSLLWPVSGVVILAKLLVAGVLIVLAYVALGEFSAEEMALGRSLLKVRIIPA
jgi:O-antigen/teichoic acid export membrane protein